jgi:hypothetical protein
VTVSNSLHFLLHYECLLFRLDEWRTDKWRMTSRLRTNSTSSLFALTLLSFLTCSPFYNLGDTNRNHHLEQLLLILSSWKPCLSNRCLSIDSFVAIRCSRNVITKPFLSNWFPLWLHSSGFQAVFTEPLPSNCHIRHDILTCSVAYNLRVFPRNCTT